MHKFTTGVQAAPWNLLADDEIAWQNFPVEKELRAEILALFTAGALAVPASHFNLSAPVMQRLKEKTGIFGLCTVQETQYITPARLRPVLDFFVQRAIRGNSYGGDQDAALESMLAGFNTLISGGPGTGKSHLIGRFVAELANRPRYGERPTRIVIAAPTGKAAARHGKIPKGKNILFETQTLHRLLGISDTGNARFHARNPVPWDIVIIDEVSMVDLGLLAMLVQALPSGAQLVLAGDLRQLPAVEGLPLDQALLFLTEKKLVVNVELTQTFRFSADKAALYARVAKEGLAAIPETSADLRRVHFTRVSQLYEYLSEYARSTYLTSRINTLRLRLSELTAADIADSPLVQEAFALIRSRVVLTELREGPLGSRAVGDHIFRIVGNTGLPDRTLTPVMATQNNYALNLYNGDSGFLVTCAGQEYAVFETADGKFRLLPLDSFSGWQIAYALTTHKSQGSEYDEVFVIYDKHRPRTDNRLLYTAVTRAKNLATILETDLE